MKVWVQPLIHNTRNGEGEVVRKSVLLGAKAALRDMHIDIFDTTPFQHPQHLMTLNAVFSIQRHRPSASSGTLDRNEVTLWLTLEVVL